MAKPKPKTTKPSINYGHVNPTSAGPGPAQPPPRKELNIPIAPADTTPPSPPDKSDTPWRD
jgi:hypothetical protein